jgi:hypothetical protein
MELILPFIQQAVVAEGEEIGQFRTGEQGGEPEPIRPIYRSTAIRSHIFSMRNLNARDGLDPNLADRPVIHNSIEQYHHPFCTKTIFPCPSPSPSSPSQNVS